MTENRHYCYIFTPSSWVSKLNVWGRPLTRFLFVCIGIQNFVGNTLSWLYYYCITTESLPVKKKAQFSMHYSLFKVPTNTYLLVDGRYCLCVRYWFKFCCFGPPGFKLKIGCKQFLTCALHALPLLQRIWCATGFYGLPDFFRSSQI